MNRDGHYNAAFFVGQEVEHTPAFGKKTLFVVGLQSESEIRRVLLSKYSQDITHIYFGANQSFPCLPNDAADSWAKWEQMILPFLQDGYWCTLDLNVSCIPGLTDGPLCERDRFIPMISVKMPYVRQLGYNAVVKIDDTDFRSTNPGVWCHDLHSLMDRSKFTDWSQYTKDTVLK